MTSISNNSNFEMVNVLVRDTWKTDLMTEASEMTSDQKFQIEKMNQILNSFKACTTIEEFHSLSEYNIESIKQAAQALQSPNEEMEGEMNPHAFCLVTHAKNLCRESELKMVGAELGAYADQLKKLYDALEKEIALAAKIKTNKVTAQHMLAGMEDTLAHAGNESLSKDIEESLIKCQVLLFKENGCLIALKPYQKDSFVGYMKKHLLPALMTSLNAPNKLEREKFDEDTLAILRKFESLMGKKTAAEEVTKEFAEFMEYLDTNEKGRELAAMLRAMSPQLGELTRKNVTSLAEIAAGNAKDRAQVEVNPANRLVEIHLSQRKGPIIVLKDSFTTRGFYSTPFTVVTTLGREKTALRLEAEQKDVTSKYRAFTDAATLAGLESWVFGQHDKSSQALAIAAHSHGEIDSKEALGEEILVSTEKILKRLHAMGTLVNMPKVLLANLIVKRALMAGDLLGEISNDQHVLDKLLMSVYDVYSADDLPQEVQEAITNAKRTVVGKKNFLVDQMKNTIRMAGARNIDKNYLRLANQFANAMALDEAEWVTVLPKIRPESRFITNLEKQFNFLGFRHLDKEDVAIMMNAALVTGVMKGTEPKDFDIVKGFMEAHSRKALGLYEAEHMSPLSTIERAKIKEMREKELQFAKVCLAYDLNISHFADKLRVRTLEMLNLIVEYRRDVLGEKDMTLEKMVLSFREFEPFHTEFYQGSIPCHRLLEALQDPETNFRVVMWLCVNLELFYEPFFVKKFSENETQLHKFEEFINDKHPEVDWIAFNKMYEQFKVSKFVKATRSHREALDKQEGISIFLPRHPLTAHSREVHLKERLKRELIVKPTSQMLEECEKESELRKKDADQQSYMPLSLWEIEYHNPELFKELGEKYDLTTKEGRTAAMKDERVQGKTIETKWGSGETMWLMNEDVLTAYKDDKKSVQIEYGTSPITKMLTRSVPMVGGISGHVECALHLAAYLGLDAEEALISTYGNLIIANAHTAAEILIGSSNFIGLIPKIDELEFNETLAPTLTQWVLEKVPEGHPRRAMVERAAEGLEK